MIMGLDGLGLPLGPAKPESPKKLEFQAVRRETKRISRERKSRYSRKKSQIDRLKRFKDGKISDTDCQGRVLNLSKRWQIDVGDSFHHFGHPISYTEINAGNQNCWQMRYLYDIMKITIRNSNILIRHIENIYFTNILLGIFIILHHRKTAQWLIAVYSGL